MSETETEMKPETVQEIGESEPGWDTFEKAYRRQGTSAEALREYAKYLGAVRKLSPKPLLKLSVEELEDLDEKLLAKSKSLRTVLKMFYRGNRRADLLESLPRQRRPKERRLGLEEILLPVDVVTLIEHAGSLRDKAIIATLASTGARINEVIGLRLRDVRVSDHCYQMWFGKTKVKSQERFSPKIEGLWKRELDKWLRVHPRRNDLQAWLFPSTAGDDAHVADQTVADMIKAAAAKAGVKKPVNPHAFRHARVSWGIMAKEDTATLCIGIWGVPFTVQLNRYTHFKNLEGGDLDAPEPRELKPVPAMPIPPALSTPSQVRTLQAEVENLRKIVAAVSDDIVPCKNCGKSLVLAWHPSGLCTDCERREPVVA